MDIAVEFTIHMTRWWLLSIPGGFMIPCGWMASDFWGHMGLVKIGESTWMIWNSWLDSRSSTFLDSSCTRNGVIKRGNSVNGGRQRAQWFWTHSMIRPIIKKKQNIEKTPWNPSKIPFACHISILGVLQLPKPCQASSSTAVRPMVVGTPPVMGFGDAKHDVNVLGIFKCSYRILPYIYIYVYVYVYVYVYAYMYMRICICVYVYAYMYMRICICAYVYAYMYMYMYIILYKYDCTCMVMYMIVCVYIYIYTVYIYTSTCVFTHICMYMYMYVYVYTYTHM